ncbi:hypothetical protein HY622_03295 [Candidatus Uhrbacteria bacterium]|nr:hypothetical protein [Candidatus Uhrbacteria bacterium]
MARERFSPSNIDRHVHPDVTQNVGKEGKRTVSEQREVQERNRELRKQTLFQEKGLLESISKQMGKRAQEVARVFIVANALFAAYPKIAEAKGVELPSFPREEQLAPQNDAFHVDVQNRNPGMHKESGVHVNSLVLMAIRDGVPVYRIIDNKELGSATTITVDGYVSGVIVNASDASSSISLNGEEGKNGKVVNSGIQYDGGIFSPLDFGGNVSFVDSRPVIFGYDTKFNPRYLGQPISELATNSLRFGDGEDSQEIIIAQHTPKILSHIGEKGSTSSIDITYLGTNPESMAAHGDKLKAAREGIQRMERFCGNDLIDRLHVVEYNKNNAYVNLSKSENRFTILSKALEERSAEDIKIVAEHEVLHKSIDQREYYQDAKLREIFADIHQAEGKKRDIILKHGVVPGQTLVLVESNPILAFINEEDYFGVQGAGHSGENMDEFLASFIHTVTAFDTFEQRLQSSIYSVTNSIDEKSDTHELPILRVYDQMLSRLAELAPDGAEKESYISAHGRIQTLIEQYKQ